MQILCATDFSTSAACAADVAAALAKKLNLPLKLLHCDPDLVVAGELPIVEMVDTQAPEQLEQEATRLRGTGIEVTTEFCQGSPSWEIIDAASVQETKWIVLGSRNVDKGEHWLDGSVAKRVAEGSNTPTLIVRQPQQLLDWLDKGDSLSVLCGVNFTTSSDAAIASLQGLRSLGPIGVDAAYIEVTSHPQKAEDRQLDLWERLHTLLGDQPMQIHVRSTTKKPALELIHMVEEMHPSLVVVGIHPRHGWQRLTGHSFSRDTLVHAMTNVLCVPTCTYKPSLKVPEIHRVLLTTDFTEVSDVALRHACSLLPTGGELRMLHVCLEPSSGINPVIASEVYFDHSQATAQAKAEAEEKIHAMLPNRIANAGLHTSMEVSTHHNVSSAICEAADRFGANVICMGSKGHTRTGTAILGSTVQSVIAQAHRPVYVVTLPET